MNKGSKHCTDIMKKHSNKRTFSTITDIADFESSAKCWICDNVYVDDDVWDNWHMTGKTRGSAHRDCNIKIKLTHKISVVFCNLNNMTHSWLCKK